MKACCAALAAAFSLSVVAGCSNADQSAQGAMAVKVKAVTVLQQDTPLASEYAGQVQATNEVQIQARVSGNLVEKLVNGGDIVHKGQPLFKIDPRQYESNLNSAKANLAQAEAVLSNSRLDTQRYQQLAAADAIDLQTLTTQQSVERQNEAVVEFNRATVQKAADDLEDTVIVSPVDGRMDVNDLSVGTFVTAGTTTLATVSSTDPVFVQFSMSENEYLKLVSLHKNGIADQWGETVSLTLSDGSLYPVTGKVTQVDKGLAQNSGTLTFKATFANPNKILIPGMFARVKISGEIVPNAILVPQRAVQPLLDKNFVTVVDADSKAETREVQLGAKVGSYYIIESGVTAGEQVVVEGLTKIQSGVALDVTLATPEELKLSLDA